MNVLEYLFIRMWSPEKECQDSDKPHYVKRLDSETGAGQWTLTRIFRDAYFFKKSRSVERVLRGVARIKSRLDRGWLYEVIHVQEEIIDSNVTVESEECI